MSGLSTSWALAELDKFIEQTVMTNTSTAGFITASNRTAASDADVTRPAQVVERIFDKVIPDWRERFHDTRHNRWTGHREAAIRAKEELIRSEELRANLGDDAPEISAADLHRWVWSGAASLWQSGHFRSAVEDAAKKVNAETQNKLRRRDLSETKLFQDAFSENAPSTDRPRLRRMPDDGSDTCKSVQRGARALAEGIYAGIRNPLSHEPDQDLSARALAEGIYAGIRNPLSHEPDQDLSEQVALEYLAALSVLARWVDGSNVETVT